MILCQDSPESVLDFIALELLHDQGPLSDENAVLIGGRIAALVGDIVWDACEAAVPPARITSFARVLNRLTASSGFGPADEHQSTDVLCP